jgi:hypothetical protein
MDLDSMFDDMDKFDLEGATKLTPREYGKLRGMAPQMVYYWIRNKVIETETCVCGRRVVDVKACDEALSTRKKT